MSAEPKSAAENSGQVWRHTASAPCPPPAGAPAPAPLDLDRLEQIARAATASIWTPSRLQHAPGITEVYVNVPAGRGLFYDGRVGGDAAFSVDGYVYDDGLPQATADAEHIAAFSPPTVLTLIAALRRAQANEIAALQKQERALEELDAARDRMALQREDIMTLGRQAGALLHSHDIACSVHGEAIGAPGCVCRVVLAADDDARRAALAEEASRHVVACARTLKLEAYPAHGSGFVAILSDDSDWAGLQDALTALDGAR